MKHPRPKMLRVEYADGVNQDFLGDFTLKIVKKFFPEASVDAIDYTVNNKIVGGIRVFFGDDMIDFSFQNFVRAIN